MLMNLKMIIRQ